MTVTTTTTIRFAAAGLIAAGALSPVALAGGEPKNDWPFTRSVNDRAPAQVRHSDSQAVVAAGEPKNQWPFTRPIADRTASQVARAAGLARIGNGEAKNEQPFTQPVLVPTVLVRASGFDWGDWAIGLVAGLGLALGLAGALILATHRLPRVGKTGAAAAG